MWNLHDRLQIQGRADIAVLSLEAGNSGRASVIQSTGRIAFLGNLGPLLVRS